MQIHSHLAIVILSSIVILSYLFNMVSKKTKLPSVLLLIGTGIAIRYGTKYYGYLEQDVMPLVKILGAVGLIMIVLEAALDLEVHRSKIKLIRDSFIAGLFIFVTSSIGISWLITYWLNEPFDKAFIYAAPLSIISSAIVIPSTHQLPTEKKEFIIYESSFSDIIGIMIFNFIITTKIITGSSVFLFFGNIGLAIIISAVASFLLMFLLSRVETTLKFFLVFAILLLVYSSGEMIHLPSLLIILVFGLLLNNSGSILKGRLANIIPPDNVKQVLGLMKTITAETAFLIRTFFFILFGYTIELNMLLEPDVVTIGSLIVLILLATRFIYLKLILKTNIFPEILLMPRGLVTILLFYSIPASKQLTNFNVGILFYVIILTSLLMMLGLIVYKDKDSIEGYNMHEV